MIEVTGSHIELSGEMSRAAFDAALAAIGEYNRASQPYAGLLEQECLIMAGGLRVRDTAAGVQVEPGCCAGLEEWRGWSCLVDGEQPWLGHSPDPGLEFRDGVARLWQDVEHTDGPACEIPLADVPAHLEGVQRDLAGFLGLVRQWAPDGLGDRLAARFDAEFRISAPL
ncbi:hypothetical protein [Lentzea sp. NBRC 102530]|uniref:hypothetical protein n=1 Tax=Lentzea sp. NBRC 102530 TaxID=3032201 RepID=UPI0024A11D07|nr:hypothetical protein [Lentzea sp. NBRC 102530]GLY51259.1 hypothetical protein Lesp01_49150 [Lentzea sp. NBRC 102530]